MTRNQTRRVEIACPVTSPELKDMLGAYLERVLGDNLKARRLQSDCNYIPVQPEADAEPLNVQQWYMDNAIELQPTLVAKKNIRSRLFGVFGWKK